MVSVSQKTHINIVPLTFNLKQEEYILQDADNHIMSLYKKIKAYKKLDWSKCLEVSKSFYFIDHEVVNCAYFYGLNNILSFTLNYCRSCMERAQRKSLWYHIFFTTLTMYYAHITLYFC